MGIFFSNFLQNLKLFWQFVENFDKQCFLIISHRRMSLFVGYFHWTFSDNYWIFRFIYWNSHFYGSNFYGWSIGDLKSLTESGPFHSQGEQGTICYEACIHSPVISNYCEQNYLKLVNREQDLLCCFHEYPCRDNFFKYWILKPFFSIWLLCIGLMKSENRMWSRVY